METGRTPTPTGTNTGRILTSPSLDEYSDIWCTTEGTGQRGRQTHSLGRCVTGTLIYGGLDGTSRDKITEPELSFRTEGRLCTPSPYRRYSVEDADKRPTPLNPKNWNI